MSDLISRQAVKEQACMFFGHEVIFANKIDLIPSADTDMSDYCDRLWKIAYERGKADRPTGEWVVKDGETVCSLCGNSVSFSRTEDGWVLGKFCQTCGAKMVREDGE